MIGRLIAQALLEWFNHRRLLLGSIVLAMSGYGVLSFTETKFGAIAAVGVDWCRLCAHLSVGSRKA